jgi:nucleoid DNA-binding protein
MVSKDSMNKSEFVSFIASKYGCTKTDAEKSLNMITDSFMAALAECDGVNLVGFGSLKKRHRKARVGRNPRTGKEINIAEYNQILFSPGKTMKDMCNS